MIRKRNPLDDTMTFGTGLPMDISGIEPPSEVPARVLPSQFPPMVQPMEGAVIGDVNNNIYDFRTIDTRQNYIRNICRLVGVLKAVKRVGRMDLSLQGGVTTESYEEKYKNQNT